RTAHPLTETHFTAGEKQEGRATAPPSLGMGTAQALLTAAALRFLLQRLLVCSLFFLGHEFVAVPCGGLRGRAAHVPRRHLIGGLLHALVCRRLLLLGLELGPVAGRGLRGRAADVGARHLVRLLLQRLLGRLELRFLLRLRFRLFLGRRRRRLGERKRRRRDERAGDQCYQELLHG